MRDFNNTITLRGGRKRFIRLGHKGHKVRVLGPDSRKDEALRDMLAKAAETLRRLGEDRVLSSDVAYIIQAYYKARRMSKENGGTAVINSRERWGVVFYAISKASSLRNRPIPEKQIIDVIREIDPSVDEDTLKSMKWRVSRRVSEFGIINKLVRAQNTPMARSGVRNSVARVKTFILSITRAMNLDMKVALAASKFVETAVKDGKTLEGRRPEAVAAAAVYLMARIAGNDWITQQAVAREAMVKEANIRKTFKYLLKDYVIIVFI